MFSAFSPHDETGQNRWEMCESNVGGIRKSSSEWCIARVCSLLRMRSTCALRSAALDSNSKEDTSAAADADVEDPADEDPSTPLKQSRLCE